MKFYTLAKPYIGKMEEYIEETLTCEKSYMYPLLLEYIKRGGKRIRPALVFLILGAMGKDPKKGIETSAIIELFHNFTLVHDDIEDDSIMRRGKPTMHISEGIPIAINSGDALYTLVWNMFFRLSMLPAKKEEIGFVLSKSFKEVVDGQAIELNWYRDKKIDISEMEYFEMIEGKTGSLIRASAVIGTILSEKKEHVENIKRYGLKVGVAFQIQDDVLNLIGEEEKYKKEIGGDITEGKRTLMLAYAISKLAKNEQDELKGIILENTKDKKKISRAIELLKKSGAIEYAQNTAKKMIDDAKKEIDFLKDSEYKQGLIELADFVIKRSH
ncbi:MAG: polyprenyl synthetase family protein [Candidatus Micrarchaeia archaeon]